MIDMHLSALHYSQEELADLLGLTIHDYNELFCESSKRRLSIRL